jgi:threonine/homoserine/homoserine lactone efflux protein
MTLEALLPLILFAFSSTFTPGPNNMMLLSSGANFGFRRTIPHMLGISVGFSFMLILVGIGIIQIFNAWEFSYVVLKTASITYMLYLAMKIATAADRLKDSETKAKPLSFTQAALFQWVNPKAWTMALTTLSLYLPTHNFISILTASTVFGLINLPSVSTWTLLGREMTRWLNNKKRLQLFNRTMAGLLLLSLYPILV